MTRFSFCQVPVRYLEQRLGFPQRFVLVTNVYPLSPKQEMQLVVLVEPILESTRSQHLIMMPPSMLIESSLGLLIFFIRHRSRP
jgi:hypothetical protein